MSEPVKGLMRGFSLIEVLVALAIFAVLASTVAFQTGNFSSQLYRLEDKSAALWVAQNAIDGLRMQAQTPTVGERDDSVEMVGKSWRVHSSVTETRRPGFLRVDVGVVADGSDGKAPILTLSAFVAER